MTAQLPAERKPLLPKESNPKTLPPANGNKEMPKPGREVYPKG